MQRKLSIKNVNYMKEIAAGKKFDNDFVELFLSRVSAFTHLVNSGGMVNEQAKLYLLETMVQPEHEYNFSSKVDFIRFIESFEDPIILAQRCDDNLCAIVYKISYSQNNTQHTIHEISFFSVVEGKFRFTHKYNLAELFEHYCNEAVTVPMIRQIGDPILHREAITVTDFHGAELVKVERQVGILRKALTKTGGVGMAANQCLELGSPLKIILSGVDYSEPEHVVKALSRYPTTLFPQMKICINPEVKALDKLTEDFAEGCLSVHGVFRASVRRPKAVTVRYQDLKGGYHEDGFTGSDARVMLHELDHILNGKVYMQRIIDELSIEQCTQLADLIGKVLSKPEIEKKDNQFLVPMVIFERDSIGKILFNPDMVESNIKNSRRDVLDNIFHILHEKISSLKDIRDNTS